MTIDHTRVELPTTEVYRITFANGNIARWTSFSRDIVMAGGAGGETFQAVPITRTPVKQHTNLKVDSVDVSFGIYEVTVGARTFSIPEVIERDYARNAHVQIYKVDYVALDELEVEFDGWLTGEIVYTGGAVTVTVASLLDKLNDRICKMVYTENCNHSLFDTYCALVKADWKETGTILGASSGGSDNNTIYADIFDFDSVYPEGYWDKGEIQIDSSASDNDGVSRTIKKHYDGYVELNIAFHDDILGGESFNVYPGCDLTGETCDEKFGNYGNSFMFELIPKPDTAV